MKKITLIATFFISTLAFGREPDVIAKFKDTARMGNFITRWYWDILGTSLVWKKHLTLYSDSTYRYIYQGGECGTFDQNTTGTWTLKGDTLTLDDGTEYLLVDKKLYWPGAYPKKRNVVMQ